uniref:CRISPR type III-associated protein domain-containing protein n=1 Tax=candidate division WOR-3 bacterium TaxID=2052148 RepID=A0A7C3N7S7_UNCW3
MDNLKIQIDKKELEMPVKNEGNIEILTMKVKIAVENDSFLHIGSTPSPLTEKKAAVFKVDRTPVIPASSFKGALRNQMELLIIQNFSNLKTLFNIDNENKLKPCIPAPRPTKSEQELLNLGYRGSRVDKKYTGHCEIQVDEDEIKITNLGICPVCYFMGATGIMGFLRFSNFYPHEGDWLVDQTNIRIDRKTGTAAPKAKVDGEQIKPGTIFHGTIEITSKTPQGFEFGNPRKIGDTVIDLWLEKWQESNINNRKKVLIETFLVPAIYNIKLLGGQKSKGSGKVKVEIEG